MSGPHIYEKKATNLIDRSKVRHLYKILMIGDL